MTAFTLKLHSGDNFIQLRLPQGSYLCVLSGSDQLLRGVGSITPVDAEATIVAMHDNMTLNQNDGKGWLRLYIGDDKYEALYISCHLSSADPEKPLFLTVGGVF